MRKIITLVIPTQIYGSSLHRQSNRPRLYQLIEVTLQFIVNLIGFMMYLGNVAKYVLNILGKYVRKISSHFQNVSLSVCSSI